MVQFLAHSTQQMFSLFSFALFFTNITVEVF